MNHRQFLGYIRVSTVRQGEHGVSLQEQRDAILRYAKQKGIEIVRWFEERESAAKYGRPIFTEMLRLLQRRKADGVVIHKIDRSARNLTDWTELVESIPEGVEVHFASEGLDLRSTGGRLAADMQAVVAAHYVRNLREEIRKGFYGRLKQGLYPLPAPLGYQDCGKGRPKIIDPVKGPLVRRVFQLYGTGRFTLDTLVEEAARLGLRNRNGEPVGRSALALLLNNPFYIGIIQVRKTGEAFPGAHEPLIGKSLFDRVQAILDGRTNQRVQEHDFLFRRLLTCKTCGRVLTGELQKGHVYYRCHGKSCPRSCVREEAVDERVSERLLPLQLSEREQSYVRAKLAERRSEAFRQHEIQLDALRLNLERLKDRLGRLTDAFLDGTVEKEIYEERKTSLLMARKDAEERRALLEESPTRLAAEVEEVFELAASAYLQWKLASAEKKRILLLRVTSNRWVEGKNVEFTLTLPFREIAKRSENSNGAPYRDSFRTLDRLIDQVTAYFVGGTPSLSDHHIAGKGRSKRWKLAA